MTITGVVGPAAVVRPASLPSLLGSGVTDSAKDHGQSRQEVEANSGKDLEADAGHTVPPWPPHDVSHASQANSDLGDLEANSEASSCDTQDIVEAQRSLRSPRRRGGSGPCGRCSFMAIVLTAAATGFIFSFVGGFVLQAVFDVEGGKTRPKMSACDYQLMGYTPVLATAVWDPASPQWVFGMTAVGVFVLHQYVFAALAKRFFGHLDESKRVKVVNYMLELFITTLVQALSVWGGFWAMMFWPHDFDLPTPEAAWRLATCISYGNLLVQVLFLIEMLADPTLRLSLKVHHWTSIIVSLWAVLSLGLVHGNPMFGRCFFPVMCYMSTEQNVFATMLLYRAGIHLPRLFYASAWFYLLSRVFLLVLSLWSWWEARFVVFDRSIVDSWIVYSLWLAIPAINLVLNATQVLTVQSLFGLAAKVRKGSSSSSF